MALVLNQCNPPAFDRVAHGLCQLCWGDWLAEPSGLATTTTYPPGSLTQPSQWSDWAKFRRPEEPASTSVVAPTRKAKSSGKMLVCPPARPWPSEPAKTCACRSISPGVTYSPE